MGLLDELDKNRPVLELIKNDESYNKKRSVLTGEEVFKLCQDRYELMQDILCPLKKKLGENIEITDISFAKAMQEESCIVVRYVKDDKQNYFFINKSDFNDVEVKSLDDRLEGLGFVLINKGIILDIFNQIDNDELDDYITINSTSNKFIVSDIMKKFVISDSARKLFSIEGSHSLYKKDGLMYNRDGIITQSPKLKEVLSSDENILNIYRHLRVYEEDIPKVLIKKAN